MIGLIRLLNKIELILIWFILRLNYFKKIDFEIFFSMHSRCFKSSLGSRSIPRKVGCGSKGIGVS